MKSFMSPKLWQFLKKLLSTIQAWPFDGGMPDISSPTENMVVRRCRIHFDASVSVSKDGQLLAAAVPDAKSTTRVGVYSLLPRTLGQLLYSSPVGFNVVSVSLSPTGKNLLVGISSNRMAVQHADKQVSISAPREAQLFT